MGLIAAGLAGGAFFMLTDPRLGWLKTRSGDNLLDAIRAGAFATYIGLAGSALAVVIGVWLMSRREFRS
jgi:hypothetical protein